MPPSGCTLHAWMSHMPCPKCLLTPFASLRLTSVSCLTLGGPASTRRRSALASPTHSSSVGAGLHAQPRCGQQPERRGAPTAHRPSPVASQSNAQCWGAKESRGAGSEIVEERVTATDEENKQAGSKLQQSKARAARRGPGWGSGGQAGGSARLAAAVIEAARAQRKLGYEKRGGGDA